MFYKTSKKCCEAFFPGKKCKVFDYGCGTSKDPPPPAPGSSPEMPGSTGVVGCVGNSGKGKYGWHMDRTHNDGCTNDENISSAWTNPNVASRMFHDTVEECCNEFFPDRECKVYGVGCATTSSGGDYTCGANGWHLNRDTNEGCTNDNNILASWTNPMLIDRMFFSSAQACCQNFFKGISCDIQNCATGSSGGSSSSSQQGGTCSGANGFHIDRTKGSGCSNDDNFPDTWLHPNQKSRMFAPTGEACCEQFFKGKECAINDCRTTTGAASPTPASSPSGSSCGANGGWHIVSECFYEVSYLKSVCY
jgi:hypothetical protein